jgi:hypothetical protein
VLRIKAGLFAASKAARMTFPFTDALQELLEAQKAEHDRLKAEDARATSVAGAPSRTRPVAADSDGTD